MVQDNLYVKSKLDSGKLEINIDQDVLGQKELVLVDVVSKNENGAVAGMDPDDVSHSVRDAAFQDIAHDELSDDDEDLETGKNVGELVNTYDDVDLKDHQDPHDLDVDGMTLMERYKTVKKVKKGNK